MFGKAFPVSPTLVENFWSMQIKPSDVQKPPQFLSHFAINAILHSYDVTLKRVKCIWATKHYDPLCIHCNASSGSLSNIKILIVQNTCYTTGIDITIHQKLAHVIAQKPLTLCSCNHLQSKLYYSFPLRLISVSICFSGRAPPLNSVPLDTKAC